MDLEELCRFLVELWFLDWRLDSRQFAHCRWVEFVARSVYLLSQNSLKL